MTCNIRNHDTQPIQAETSGIDMTPTKVGHVQSFHSLCESCKITSVCMSYPRRRIVNRHIVRNPSTMFCFTKQNLRPTCSATANVPIQKNHDHFVYCQFIGTWPQFIGLQNPQKDRFFFSGFVKVNAIKSI